MQKSAFRSEAIDREQIRILAKLPPHKRVRAMLDARELAVGLIRGRLRKKYPDLPINLLNLKVLEELAREDFVPRYLYRLPALGSDINVAVHRREFTE